MKEYIRIGGIPTPLKNMNVSWDDYSKYMEKHMFQPTNQFGYLESHWPSFFRGL